MAETAIGYTVGLLVSGIALIGKNIEQFQIQNQKVLELHSEILMMKPFISTLTESAESSGVHNRLQRLLVLLEEIRIWIEGFGRKSKLKHFFFALSHKKDIHFFYARISELKRELGFEMKVGNYMAQQQLNQQISELVCGIEASSSAPITQHIKSLMDLQQRLCDLKLDNQLTYITNMDQRHTILLKEYECEIKVLKHETEQVKEYIMQLQQKVDALEKNCVAKPAEISAFGRFLVNEYSQIAPHSENLLLKLWSQHPDNPECVARIEECRLQIIKSQNYAMELVKLKHAENSPLLAEEKEPSPSKSLEEDPDYVSSHPYSSLDDSVLWQEKCKTMYQNVPRLQGIYGDYQTFLDAQRVKRGRSFKKITSMFEFEAEQLVTNPKLLPELRNIWDHTPRIRRLFTNHIGTFLHSMNWMQLRDKYLPEYLEATNCEHLHTEKMLIIIYNQSPNIQLEFGTLHEFMFRENLTFPALYKKYQSRWEKDTEYYDKCMFLWENVPRLKYNWNGILNGFLSYTSGDLKYLYYTFHPEFVQLQTDPDLRHKLDKIWKMSPRVRHLFKNNYHRWLWADLNWADKFEKYKGDLYEMERMPDLEWRLTCLYLESSGIQNQFHNSLYDFLYQKDKTFYTILNEFAK